MLRGGRQCIFPVSNSGKMTSVNRQGMTVSAHIYDVRHMVGVKLDFDSCISRVKGEPLY